MKLNFIQFYIKRKKKFILISMLAFFILFLNFSPNLFYITTIFESSSQIPKGEIIKINTNDIVNNKIISFRIKIDFIFSDYHQFDNLFQTDMANNGLRLEISPTYSMNLLQLSNANKFYVTNVIDKLEIGQNYELIITINNNIIKSSILNKNQNRRYTSSQKNYQFSSVNNIWVGGGFNEERFFSGKIHSYMIEIKSYSLKQLKFLKYCNYLSFFIIIFIIIFIIYTNYNRLQKRFLFITNISIDKLIIYLLIYFIFILGFLMRFQLYNIPFCGPDSIGYLGVALQYLESSYFGQIAERPYPYPLFLTFLLSLSKNITIIPTVQHMLGLGAGVLYLRILFFVNSLFLRVNIKLNFIYNFIGVLGLYILLCSDWSVKIEHYAHPEALTTFLIMFLIFIYLKFYQSCIQQISFYWILIYGSSFFLLNYLFFIYQPRYGVNFISMIILFLITIFLNIKLRQSLLIIFSSVFLTYILLIIPFSTFSDNQKINNNIAASFFFHNMHTIVPLIQDDLEKNNLRMDEINLLKSILDDYIVARNPNTDFSSGFNVSLKLNTDYFNRTYYKILDFFNHDYVKSREFYIGYLKKAILTNSPALIGKIVNEFFYFYTDNVTFKMLPTSKKAWDYSFVTASSFKTYFPKSELLGIYISGLNFTKGINDESYFKIYSNINQIEIFLKKSLPFIIVIFILLLIIDLKYKKLYYKFGFFTLSILMIQIGFNMTISITNTNSVLRYFNDQVAVLVLFEFYGIVFIMLNLISFNVDRLRLKKKFTLMKKK